MSKIDYADKTLMEIALIATEAVDQFEAKMKIDFPEGSPVKFQLNENSEVLEGTVSKHQFMPADAITGGLIIDIPEDVQDKCPTYLVNQGYGHIRVQWIQVYRAAKAEIPPDDKKEYWPCACVKRDRAGNQTHIKLNHKSVKKCGRCKFSRPEGWLDQP